MPSAKHSKMWTLERWFWSLSDIKLALVLMARQGQACFGIGQATQGSLGRHVGPGRRVSRALGRQVGSGTAVSETLGSQVGPGTAVLQNLGCFLLMSGSFAKSANRTGIGCKALANKIAKALYVMRPGNKVTLDQSFLPLSEVDLKGRSDYEKGKKDAIRSQEQPKHCLGWW